MKINYKQDLNKEQLGVVQKADGPCLVLAGAGSGKTRTLIYRIAYLLEQGINHERILLVTFTNKAANEMRERLTGLVGETGKKVWAGTFHHIANKLLRKYAHLIEYPLGFNILDQSESLSLFKKVFKENYPVLMEQSSPEAFFSAYSFARNSLQEPSETVSRRFSFDLSVQDQQAVVDVMERYQKKKRFLKVMDFDDLLYFWYLILKKYPEVRKALQNKFQYLLVDEYQDTNRIQSEILKLMTNQEENLLVVGDDSQSIYAFRGAEISNILNFPKLFKNSQTFKLIKNYRSSQEIMDVSNCSILNNRKQFKKEIESVNGYSGSKPNLVVCKDIKEQAHFIIQQIQEDMDSGSKLKNIAVLFRSAYLARDLELNVNKHGLPYVFRGGMKFFEQAHIKDILAVLRVLNNVKDEIAWLRLIMLLPGIGKVRAEKIISKVNQANNLEDYKLLLIADNSLNKLFKGGEILEDLFSFLLKINVKNIKVIDVIQGFVELFYQDYAKKHFEDWDERKLELDFLGRLSSQYQDLSLFINETCLGDDFKKEANNQEKDYLVLSTIHQAKGLEWDKVFIIGLVDGQFPHIKDDKVNLEEERRLFYVASTRAKKDLYFMYPFFSGMNHYYSQASTDDFTANNMSRFLEELDKNLYKQISLVPNIGKNFNQEAEDFLEEEDYEDVIYYD